MSVTCFLCLTATKNATKVDKENHEICNQIQDCLQLKISFGIKSASICNDCLTNLNSAHGFFTKIHKLQSDNAKLQLKLSACESDPKILKVGDEKIGINNNCLESLEEAELDIKDELLEEEKSNESCEEDVSNDEDDSEDDEDKKETKALATINHWKSYPWYCYLCAYSTLNFSTLIAHIKSKHDISDIKKIQYQCIDCTKKLNGYTLFLNHVRLEHQPTLKKCCDICSESFGEYSKLAEHRRQHNDDSDLLQPQVYHCNNCLKVFPTRQTINSHFLSHSRALQCKNCDKRFQRLKYLKRHMMEIHKELKYKCSYCNKTFCRQFNKISHERTHTLERPYKCNQCEKVFRFQSTLKTHQYTHSTDRPYKCNQCSSSFYHAYTLKEHMRKHTKENPFSCEECHKTFRYRKSWRRHMYVHAAKKEETTKPSSKNSKKTKTPISKAKTKKPITKKTSEGKKN